MAEYSYYETVVYDNFQQMIKGWNTRHPETVAIRYIKKDKEFSHTYKDLTEDIVSIYKYYCNNNIHNKKIGIISENRYEYIPIYLASVFDNIIAPLDKELDEKTLVETICDFDIDIVFFTNKTEEKIKNINNLKKINIDDEYENIVKQRYSVDDFLKNTADTDKDRFAILASTSGTDGKMKGVMLSQYNVIVNVRGTLENNILKSPTLSLLPMNHTYGFNPGVLATLYNGTTVCLNLELKYIVRDLKKFNPYFFEAVPLIIEGMYKNIIREAKRKNKYKTLCTMIKISNFLLKMKIDLRHLFFGNIINKRLRLVVSGGAALNYQYVEKYNEIGIKILNGYGLTECAPTIAVSREHNNIPGSSGTIMKNISVKIAEDGEILVKGPNVMLGYYKNEKATKEAFVDGYLKTGDLGRVENNVIFVTGRKKNLIITNNGKNFSPEVVESKIMEIPYIKECVVTTKNKNDVLAKVYMEEPVEESVLKSDIKRINKTLPKFMHIDCFEIMQEEFEKTSSKKIRRDKYVEQF